MRDFNPRFPHDLWSEHGKPSCSSLLLPTDFCFSEWDSRHAMNFYNAAYQRMGVDTQALTRLIDPHYGYDNNPQARAAFRLAARRMSDWLVDRCCRCHAKPVPLSYEGACYVIEKLRGIQPRKKIDKLYQVAKRINWHDVARHGLHCVPQTTVATFIKREGYPDGTKPPRLIAYPKEGEKLLMTMAFYHVLHPLFSSVYCTKELPEDVMPRAIEKRLSPCTGPVIVCDYTSFECVPTRQLLRDGEHYVLRRVVPEEYHFLFDVIERGGNLRSRSGVLIKTPAVQYSGRYTTSLSNTIRNKLLMDAAAIMCGVDYCGVFEGDDSLTSWPPNFDPLGLQHNLRRLGVDVDMSVVRRAGVAGYCSRFWDTNYNMVVDPIRVLSTFPISHSQLANSKTRVPLLAAKAMSLAYRAPGCPIVSTLVKMFIRDAGLMDSQNQYSLDFFRRFTKVQAKGGRLNVCFTRWDLVRDPTKQQRELFAEVFNIPISAQLFAEEHLHRYGFTKLLLLSMSAAFDRLGYNFHGLCDNFTLMARLSYREGLTF